jgi:hypothetical protein
MSADRRLDRAGETAQVVLVGAVAMAFIIVGLVVVSNTVLYSESVGSEGSLSSADETAEFQGIARDSTASTVYRVNERNDFATSPAGKDALDDAVRNNVTNLSNLLATEYGQEYGVFVDVEPDLANSEYGARVEQDAETFFNNSGGGGDTWDPVDTPTTVTEFEASFNVSEMPDLGAPGDSADRFAITIANGSASRDIEVFNDSGNLSIAGGSASSECSQIDDGLLLVDLQNGSVPGTDCTFGGVDAVDGQVTVEFSNGDAAVGTYSFVVEDYAIGEDSKYANAGGGQPYSATVYWMVAVDVTYDGPEVGYDLSREVPIYATPADISVAPWLTSPASVFFYDGTNVSVINGNRSSVISVATPDNAEALGPVTTDLTGDGRPDIPYVNSNGELVITNDTNDTTVLATSGDISGNIENSKTRLAVGSWNGSASSVFFTNDGATIYRVVPGGSPQVVVESSDLGDGAQAVVGPGDIDGDGADELIYADGSQTIQYVEPGGSATNTVDSGGVGSSSGIGSGSVADFDGDGTVVVVTITGGNEVKIVGESTTDGGEGTTILSGTNAKQSPVTIADVDLDGDDEIVYVGADDGKLKYVDDVRGSNTVKFLRDANGDKIDAEDTTGVT